MSELKAQIAKAAWEEAETRLGKAAMDRWRFDLGIGLFKVYEGHKMEGNTYVEVTRNMETGEVKRENGKTVTKEMLSAVAALDLCKEGAYHKGLGGWIEAEAIPLRWYSVVVNKLENEND